MGPLSSAWGGVGGVRPPSLSQPFLFLPYLCRPRAAAPGGLPPSHRSENCPKMQISRSRGHFVFSIFPHGKKKMVLLSAEWKAVVPSRTFLQLLGSARVPRAKPQGQGSPWHPGCCRKHKAQEQGKVPGCSLRPEGLFVLRRSSNRSPCALVTRCCKSPLCLLLELFIIPF